jgi:hypothetical protein
MATETLDIHISPPVQINVTVPDPARFISTSEDEIIQLDIIVTPPVSLECQISEPLFMVPSDAPEPLFSTWNALMFTTGEKKTGRDAGIYQQLSFTDDYIYFCVFGGLAGTAIWKKTLLFQT